jgi:NADH-quinone oxidoreductase subunit N
MFTQFFDPRDFGLILPQVMLALFGLGILLTDFLLDARQKWMNAVMAMVGVGFSGFALWRLNSGLLQFRGDTFRGFNNSLVVDPFFIFFGFIFLAATALVILLSVKYLEIEGEHHGEYYALMLFAAVGMMFLACGQDLIVLFISLETMAASFYVLTGFLRRDRRSNEGALKYVLLGAFSSGILAYGFSILYGISGSTNLQVIASAVAMRGPGDVLVLLALVTTAAGLFFKISAVPFHQWAPDVYEGAPTSITAYLSVASTAASFALLLRIFTTAFWPVRTDWQWLLGAVALATLTVGNFAALTQTNVKRLLAYSSIAHAGYMLLGLVAGNATGLKAMAFYLFMYTFMNIGAFGIVILLRRQDLIGDTLEDLNGLYRRNPAAALLLLIFMLSLAGIPPTAGFLGKWFIFQALLETKHYTLAVLAALYVVPGLYYYFRLIKHAWLSEARDAVAPRMSLAQGVVLGVAAFVSLVGLLYAEPFVKLVAYAFSLNR